jgi:alkylation response protein AidB-like acyl-CoA dehydrogenase
MVEQGWMGIVTPEDAGGLGLGWVEAAVLLEQIGRHVAPAPFLPSLVALDALVRSGAAGERWVQPLIDGARIGAVAWAGGAGRPGTGAITSAPASAAAGDEVRLRARLGPTVAAPAADVIVVVTPEAAYGIEVDDMTRPAAEPAMDATRTLGWLELDNAPATCLGGADFAESVLDRAAVAVSAEMLGSAARVLEMAAQYAKDRVQFGQPIGSFQAVKHRCADMVVDVEGMRSTAWFAAWCLSSGDDSEDPSVAASTAKIWCSDASKRVMASGLQVHGGIGFTWEHDLHLYLKRAQLDQISFGDASFHRDRLAARLRARVHAGRSVI